MLQRQRPAARGWWLLGLVILLVLELFRLVPAASAKGKRRRALGWGHRDAPCQDPHSASDPSIFLLGMGPSRLAFSVSG